MLFQLHTPRLRLRRWQASDYAPFAALNADEEVMRHFPNPLSEAESNGAADRISDKLEDQGWGLWAVELIDGGNFIGFIGLSQTDVTPQGEVVEVGWRLQRSAWGNGYATEGAEAALIFAFEILNLSEVYSLTSTTNDRSQAVMQRLGMTNTGENFMHPKIEAGNPLREHVLYQISAAQFQSELPVEIETVSKQVTS